MEKNRLEIKKSYHILRVGPFLSRNLQEHGQISLKNEGRKFHKKKNKKNRNALGDHIMNIPTKFDSVWLCSFREEA